MVKWYFSKDRLMNRTPSRSNGVDFPTECRYRREGCRFIMDMGNKLGLRYDTMATGVIYFHRFYMKQSFKTFPRWVTACACLFLAGKVEETPKKCRDIITVAKKMLSEHHFRLFGENPREEVMIYERVLLQTIKFDLQVEHPYGILLKVGKLLKGDKGKIQKLVQMAWTFVNDSLSTSLSLRKRPEILAIAHLNLAGKLANFDLKASTDSPSSKPWWFSFNTECQEQVVEEICDEMLELYGAKKEKPQKKSLGEKLEPSPNNSSSHSSPSVTNSPPFKRKKLENKDVKSTPIPVSSKAGSKVVSVSRQATINNVAISGTETTSGSVVQISASLQPVENVSPVVASDSFPRTTSYSAPSSMPPSNVPPVPSPLVQPTVPYMNPVMPHAAYLASTFSPIPFGIPPPTDPTIPVSSSSSTLLPPPNLVPPTSLVGVQNATGFAQTFPHVPPPLHQRPPSHQGHTQPPPLQPPPSFIQAQHPPAHMQPLPTHTIQTQPPPTHLHTQPPPTQIHPHPPPSHMQTQPPPSHIQPPLDGHQQPSNPTYAQRPPLPPHKLFPSMHHPTQQPPPIQMMPRPGMNNPVPPPVSVNNKANWRTPGYNRPPNTRPMGRGGWMM